MNHKATKSKTNTGTCTDPGKLRKVELSLLLAMENVYNKVIFYETSQNTVRLKRLEHLDNITKYSKT